MNFKALQTARFIMINGRLTEITSNVKGAKGWETVIYTNYGGYSCDFLMGIGEYKDNIIEVITQESHPEEFL